VQKDEGNEHLAQTVSSSKTAMLVMMAMVSRQRNDELQLLLDAQNGSLTRATTRSRN
jgi:hypothetical protein